MGVPPSIESIWGSSIRFDESTVISEPSACQFTLPHQSWTGVEAERKVVESADACVGGETKGGEATAPGGEHATEGHESGAIFLG